MRLAALLNTEETQYQQELVQNIETPEQVRQKMAERLFVLKEKREQERLQAVEHLNEKRFRDTTDDLRKEDSKFYTQQCAIQREQQLHEKRQKLERDILEEQVYAALWEQDRRAKEERERKEKDEKFKMQKDTLDVLEWQKQQNNVKNYTEKEAAAHEKNMLNQQWQMESEKEKLLEDQSLSLIHI